ncbi:MAG: luciferase family protein, partial [Mycobacterium sp.]|nr:luciferase family protein [Mycobacterium sp.]
EGPKNVAQTAEIADGWLPLFYTPRSAGLYRGWLDEGFARPGARRTRADFEIAATCQLQLVANAAEKEAVLAAMKPSVALYMGGMGAREANFHNQVFARMGYAELAARVQELYLAGERDRAAALIPDALVDDLHIVGTAAEVRDKVAQWEDSGVTTLLLSLGSPAEVRQVAGLLA